MEVSHLVVEHLVVEGEHLKLFCTALGEHQEGGLEGQLQGDLPVDMQMYLIVPQVFPYQEELAGCHQGLPLSWQVLPADLLLSQPPLFCALPPFPS